MVKPTDPLSRYIEYVLPSDAQICPRWGALQGQRWAPLEVAPVWELVERVVKE